MPRPSHLNRNILGGVGIVIAGCTDQRLILGLNLTGSGDTQPTDATSAEASEEASTDPIDAAGTAPSDAGTTQADAAEEAQLVDGGLDAGSVYANANAPSCKATGDGLTNCGVNPPESCCTSLPVEGGSYFRTYKNTGTGATATTDPATVSSFRLDKYLVTVGRFRQFVAAWKGGAGWVPPVGAGIHTHLNAGKGLAATGGGYELGWIAADDAHIVPTDKNLNCTGPLVADLATGSVYATWTPAAGNQETLPITCENWYEAYAFCIWDGGFLPSEAEVGYAEAGGDQQLEFPWGTKNPGVGYIWADYGCYFPDLSGTCTGVASIPAVGTAASGAGRWGQLDLAGTLWEWTIDWYANYITPCVDCASLTTAAAGRATRGGDFNTGISAFPPARHPNAPADTGAYAYGFRCARTPLP